MSPDLLSFWVSDGGQAVLSEEDHTTSEIQGKLREWMYPNYLQTMADGPTHLHLGDIPFFHAGVHPYGDIPEFLEQDRLFYRSCYHWATMWHPFLLHQEGWDSRDVDPERRERRPTIILHGHTPTLRRDITTDADLGICDGMDSHRAMALDTGAAYGPQLAYAHIRSRGAKTEVQLHAVRGGIGGCAMTQNASARQIVRIAYFLPQR